MFNGRRLTLLIIPEEGERTYEYKIPRILVWLAGLSAVLAVALLAIGIRGVLSANSLQERVALLERDRALLAEKVRLIEDLEVTLDRLKKSNQQLRRITAEAVGLGHTTGRQVVDRTSEVQISVLQRLRHGRLRNAPTLMPVRHHRLEARDEGVLFHARLGSLVRASAAGKVRSADFRHGLGLVIEIDHGNGVRTLYGSLATIIAGEGEYMQKGQPLGLSGYEHGSGLTGVSFSVIEGGRHLSPTDYSLWL